MTTMTERTLFNKIREQVEQYALVSGKQYAVSLTAAEWRELLQSLAAQPVQWPKVWGTGRVADNPCVLEVNFQTVPTDDELRAFDEVIKGRANAAPAPEAQTDIVSWLKSWWQLDDDRRAARRIEYGPDVAHLLRGVADMIEGEPAPESREDSEASWAAVDAGITEIPEGRRSSSAGALVDGSPSDVARERNPGGATPGGVEILRNPDGTPFFWQPRHDECQRGCDCHMRGYQPCHGECELLKRVAPAPTSPTTEGMRMVLAEELTAEAVTLLATGGHSLQTVDLLRRAAAALRRAGGE